MNEFLTFLEVFVLQDYQVPGLAWRSIRTIVDVGANIGTATIWFAEQAPEAKIVAVEPSPDALSLLSWNLGSNTLGSRVVVLPIALGATSGVGYLQPADSSVGTQVGTRPPHVNAPVAVRVATLAGLMGDEDLPRIDLLKLDCEGAEYDVLLSSDATVLRRIATIVGEYHRTREHDPSELQAHLERCGFHFYTRPHPRDATLGIFVAQQYSQ